MPEAIIVLIRVIALWNIHEKNKETSFEGNCRHYFPVVLGGSSMLLVRIFNQFSVLFTTFNLFLDFAPIWVNILNTITLSYM